MTKLVRITATGAAALLMTAAGVLGAGAATAADGKVGAMGTAGTRVRAADGWEWSIGTDTWEWSIGTDVWEW